MQDDQTDWKSVERLMKVLDDGTEYALDRILDGDTRHLSRELRRRALKQPSSLEGDILERYRHEDSYDWVVMHLGDKLSSGQCALLAARMEGFTMRELAKELECTHTTVCRLFAGISKKLFQNGALDDLV